MKKAASKSRLRNAPAAVLSLSKVVEQHPDQEHDKLSLVQKGVAVLDVLPQQYHRIHTLYLSGNFLSELRAIGQFKQLRVLSLASNAIYSVHELKYLWQLTQLENLCLTGNAVSKHALYRTVVCGGCKQLKILDGSTVTHSQRMRLDSVLMVVEQRFEELMRNYWTMEKMCRFAKNIDLHSHINRKEECCRVDSLEKYLRLCDLSEQYSDSAKEKLWNSLYQDCMLIYASTAHQQLQNQEDRFIESSTDLLERQSAKICELQKKLSTKIHSQHSQEPVSDSELFGAIESKLLNEQKAAKCRSLFLLVNAFLALKHNVSGSSKQYKRSCNQAKRKLGVELGSQIIDLVLLRAKKSAYTAVKLYTECTQSTQSRIKAIEHLRMRHRLRLLIGFVAEQRSHQQDSKFEEIKQKRQRKDLLRKYIGSWKDEYQKRSIENNTKEVCRMFEELRTRQKKQAQKAQLLEEYVEVLKNQHDRELAELQQSKATKRPQSPESGRFVTFETSSSPQRQLRLQQRFERESNSSSREHLKISRINNYAVGRSEYGLESETKENCGGMFNTLTKTRQRVLNRRDRSEVQRSQLQNRRQEIMSRLKEISLL